MSPPLRNLTLGEVEAALANAIIQFEKEHLGRGPLETRVFIIEDMVLVRLRGVLTPADVKLAESREGHRLIREVRRELIEGSRELLEAIVLEKTGVPTVDLHTDISIPSGERVIVFSMAENLETRFKRKK